MGLQRRETEAGHYGNETYDFTAGRDMLIESIETQSVLAITGVGTFRIQVEINGRVVSAVNQYVNTNEFKSYINSENVTYNLKAGDKVTYRVYGSTNDFIAYAIRGVSYVKLCGTEGIQLTPSWFRDDVLSLVNEIDTPLSYPCGLAVDGTYFWLKECWERKVYKINASGNIIHSFDSFWDGGDLAFDGEYLWLGGGSSNKIYKIGATGEVVDTIDSPGEDPYGLEYYSGYLWVTSSNTTSNKVYKISESGSVYLTFDSPGNGFKGLAFDGNNLWHVDAVSMTIYKFDPKGNLIEKLIFPIAIAPRGLAASEKFLWVSSYYDSKIYQLEIPQALPTGTSKRQTFAFQVTGTQNAAIDTISIMNGDGQTFTTENDTCSGKTLSLQDSCTFDILFAPVSPGVHTANVLISISLPEPHEISVPLKWTAVEKPVPKPLKDLPWIPLLLLGQ
jgi:hypothetical protein